MELDDRQVACQTPPPRLPPPPLGGGGWGGGGGEREEAGRTLPGWYSVPTITGLLNRISFVTRSLAICVHGSLL